MIEEIIEYLNVLYKNKPNRLRHVLGVRDTALKFGEKYNLDLFKLEVAALLHDITKYYSEEENKEVIMEYFDDWEIIFSEYNKQILHAFSAVVMAQKMYGIKDEIILGSILNHTVGKPEMNIYEEVLFISDYTEPGRSYDSCLRVREIAKEDIKLAVYTAIDDSINFYEAENSFVPKIAYLAREYYKKKVEN